MSSFRPTPVVNHKYDEIALPHKPSAPLAYTYRPPTFSSSSATSEPIHLLIFLNGLAHPQSGWQPLISLLCGERETIEEGLHDPPRYGKERRFGILTYDSFGQGETSSRDPSDSMEGKENGFGHDLNEVVADLAALIRAAVEDKHPSQAPVPFVPPLITFCANSIGCAIARHYAALYPGTVAGLILLDPIMAHSNFTTDIFPSPSSPGLSLPKGVTMDKYDEQREKYAKMFAPTGPSKESFDRRNMAAILPSAFSPILIGPSPPGSASPAPPFLRVVSHDPETFAEDSLRDLGAPLALTDTFIHAAMMKNCEELLRICPGRNIPKGAGEAKVIVAKGCGHFVQKDGPGLCSAVVEEVLIEAGW